LHDRHFLGAEKDAANDKGEANYEKPEPTDEQMPGLRFDGSARHFDWPPGVRR
jgi:hypothetical protein